MPAPEDPRVTVVVATRDRRDEVAVTLPRHHAPVVLVDNASSDGTADLVPDAVRLPHNLGAAARTLGVRRATTPYVAFADDDSWWAPGSLRRAVEVLEATGAAALCARILVGPEERLDPFCDVLAASPLRHGDHPRLLGFVACATVVRRDAFLAVGGFDDVVRFPGEEERVALDLAERGDVVLYADDVVVHHHPSPRRHGPEARAAAVTRSALLTALLRLPWREVRARVRGALATAPGRRGLVAALRDAPRALARRRVVGPHVLHDLETLAAAPALTTGGNA